NEEIVALELLERAGKRRRGPYVDVELLGAERARQVVRALRLALHVENRGPARNGDGRCDTVVRRERVLRHSIDFQCVRDLAADAHDGRNAHLVRAGDEVYVFDAPEAVQDFALIEA